MKYHFKVHKEKNGYWAECMELGGCQSQGGSMEKLLSNLHEALNLYLSEPENSAVIFPHPKRNVKGRSIIKIEVDPSVAAATTIRQLRVKMHLTQQKMKETLGINNLSSYQRLEDPKRCNPELKTLANIKKHFPEFRLDEII